jgi:hypothetical protein
MNRLASFDSWLRKPMALGILLGLYVIISFVCVQYRSYVDDEADYYYYAVRCLQGHPERVKKLDDSKTVLMLPALVPRVALQIFNPQLKRSDNGRSDIINGRYTIVVYALLMMVFLWLFLKKVTPEYGMLLIPLAVIDPLLTTYSTVLTSDMAVAACTMAFFYYAFQFYTYKRTRDLLLMSIAIGLGIVGKFSFAPVLMGFGIGFILMFYRKLNNKKDLLFLLKSGLISLVVVLLVVNITYPTDRRFFLLKNESFQSERFNSLSKGFTGSIPVPIPANMVHAADMLSYHAQSNLPDKDLTYLGATWLLHSFREPPLWYYYWFLLLVKTPVFLLILFIIGAGFIFVNARKNKFIFLATFVALFYCLYGGLFNKFQIGVRHLLTIYPLFFIVGGLALSVIAGQFSKKYFQTIYCCGCLWILASVLYFFPHFMAYTNEFIPDKKLAHWYVSQCVIDYGQVTEYAEAFRSKNPQYKDPVSDTLHHEKFAVCSGALLFSAYHDKNPNAIKLLKRKPDRIERFVLLIFE